MPTYFGSNRYTIDSDFVVLLTVYQTNVGTVVVPIQWDYVAWTPMAERFITALKAQKLDTLVSGYTVILTGAVSPLIAQALAGRGGDGHDQSAPRAR